MSASDDPAGDTAADPGARGDGANVVRRLRLSLRRGRDIAVGDHLGLTIFLGSLVLYMLYWRVDVFIVDTFVVANTLANLANGHLHMEQLVYGPAHGRLPGMHIVDGRLYGRNYGQVAFALPVLWLLELVTALVDFRVALAALWSGLVVAFGVALARTVEDRRWVFVGCGVALVGLEVNVLLATDLSTRLLPLVALQVSTMLAAGLLAATIYRLVRRLHGVRPGVFAGVATALLGPVGFWASIPKRHVLLAALAAFAVYAFYRSRAADGERALGFRALAYACVGISAWVAAPESLVLLLVLAPVDLLTARANDRRTLAVVAGAFAVSLVPFLLTNALLSGNPLQPPRLLPSYRAVATAASGTGSAGGGSGATAAAGGGGGTGAGGGAPGAGVAVVPMGVALLDAAATGLGMVWSQVGDGLAALSPERLSHVFLRSGRIPGVDRGMTGGQPIDLTVLETAPLFGALAVVPLRFAVRRRGTGRPRLPTLAGVRAWRPSPARATDLLVTGYAGLLLLAFLPRLPLHSTITVRYLVPAMPLLVYGLARLATVRAVVEREPRRLVATTAVTALVACVAALVAFVGTSAGAAMQGHAVVNLGLAGVVAAWFLTADGDRSSAVGAVALGLALGATLSFLLLSGLEYFGSGRQFALPIADAVQRLLPVR